MAACSSSLRVLWLAPVIAVGELFAALDDQPVLNLLLVICVSMLVMISMIWYVI